MIEMLSFEAAFEISWFEEFFIRVSLVTGMLVKLFFLRLASS